MRTRTAKRHPRRLRPEPPGPWIVRPQGAGPGQRSAGSSPTANLARQTQTRWQHRVRDANEDLTRPAERALPGLFGPSQPALRPHFGPARPARAVVPFELQRPTSTPKAEPVRPTDRPCEVWLAETVAGGASAAQRSGVGARPVEGPRVEPSPRPAGRSSAARGTNSRSQETRTTSARLAEQSHPSTRSRSRSNGR